MSNNKPNLNILKTLLWNANSLKQDDSELLHLLLGKEIDIPLIRETHCKPITKIFSLILTFLDLTILIKQRTLDRLL